MVVRLLPKQRTRVQFSLLASFLAKFTTGTKVGVVPNFQYCIKIQHLPTNRRGILRAYFRGVCKKET